jgi:hypothetical protein
MSDGLVMAIDPPISVNQRQLAKPDLVPYRQQKQQILGPKRK